MTNNSKKSITKYYPVNNILKAPWNSKNEWLDVYRKVYSGNLSDQIEAYNMMKIWQKSGKRCPLAVISTCAMLQGVIKDKAFHPELEHGLAVEDLQLIYGGSIMRFLNLLCSKELERADGNTKSNYTLYTKAHKLKLPEWIVDVRHDMAHGKKLPGIQILRVCVISILTHLKSRYWKIEKKQLHDVILARPRNETLQEHLTKLLTIYILIREQEILGYKSCATIKDPSVTREILMIEEYRLVSEQLKNAPWEVNYLEKKNLKHLTEEKLKTYPFLKLYSKVAKYICEYHSVRVIDSWDIFVSFIIDDSVKHQGVRLNIWGNLLRSFSERNCIKNILDIFLNITFSETKNIDVSFWARKWLTVILQALLKRSKIEKLKLALSGKIKKRGWMIKIISSLKLLEIERLKHLMYRKNFVEKQDGIQFRLHNILFNIIEKRDRRLRSKLRFFCDPLDDDTIMQCVYRCCKEPNDFTLAAFDFFSDMYSEPTLALKKHIKELINIYQGNNRSSTRIVTAPNSPVYTLPMLFKKLGIPERELAKYMDVAEPNDNQADEEVIDYSNLPRESTFICANEMEEITCPTLFPLPWEDIDIDQH